MYKGDDHTAGIGIAPWHIVHRNGGAYKWNIIEWVDDQPDVWVWKRDKRNGRIHKVNIDTDHRFQVCVGNVHRISFLFSSLFNPLLLYDLTIYLLLFFRRGGLFNCIPE